MYNHLKKFLKEPLVYFLILGGALFALFQQVSVDGLNTNNPVEEIIVTQGRIEALAQGFRKVRQRPPSQQELDGLIQAFVREEVLYREALIMGLDRDDPIVRRRMTQKVEFISEDLAALEDPGDTELQAFLDANPAPYRQPARFSFRHVFLNVNERGRSAQANAKELLEVLRMGDADAVAMGDSLMMLPREFKLATEHDIERALGRQFVLALGKAPTNNWQGPIESGFGLHLVYIDQRIDGELPELGKIREMVFRDWASERRKQTNKTFYEALRKRYKVTIAKPKTEAESTASVAGEVN